MPKLVALMTRLLQRSKPYRSPRLKATQPWSARFAWTSISTGSIFQFVRPIAFVPDRRIKFLKASKRFLSKRLALFDPLFLRIRTAHAYAEKRFFFENVKCPANATADPERILAHTIDFLGRSPFVFFPAFA